MIEKYLHYLWEYKIIPFHQLPFFKMHQFKVLNYGTYNSFESGPDFKNVQFKLDDLIWCGNVEMHIRSSDWNRHKHQQDRAYDNVILHVVYEHDVEINQHGFVIPTIELKNCIDWKHFGTFQSLLKHKNKIFCGSQFLSISILERTNFLERSLFNRLTRKTQLHIKEDFCSPQQFLFHFLFQAFGTKTNQLAFEELATRLSVDKLKQMDADSQRNEIMTLSNLLNKSFDSSPFLMNKSSWKFGGVRPQNSPLIRLNQLVDIVNAFDFRIDFITFKTDEIIRFFKDIVFICSIQNIPALSNSFKNLLLINGVVPFLFWYGNFLEDDSLIEKAFDILYALPPENNRIINKWKHFNIKPKNAAESQAYLEIFNEFCTNKKCLTCSIGKQLLGK